MNKRERRRERLRLAAEGAKERLETHEDSLGEPAPDEPPAVTLDEALAEVTDE